MTYPATQTTNPATDQAADPGTPNLPIDAHWLTRIERDGGKAALREFIDTRSMEDGLCLATMIFIQSGITDKP